MALKRLGRRMAVAAVMGAMAGSAPGMAANPTAGVVPPACDRTCLTGQLTAALAAMTTHDLSRLPLAAHVRSTENGVRIALWDGLWATAGALGRYRLDVVDAEGGQAATLATVIEDGKPVYIALRLRVHEGKIDEVELLSARGTAPGSTATAGTLMEQRGTPRPQFARTVPERERMERDALVRVADSYFANLQGSTGRTSAPFARTCLRIENGAQTTDVQTPRAGREGQFDALMLGCEAQQRSGFYPFVTAIRDRRYPVVDRTRGLVLAFGYFDHSGTIERMTLTDGRIIPAPFRSPLTFAIAELFQIDRSRIDQVEAALVTVPYRMRADIWDRAE